MPRIKARRVLDDIESTRIDFMRFHPDALYDVAFEATGNEEVANAWRVQRIKVEMDMKQKARE
jgi:aromatic ring-opening dioxygenase catalytic subunit (LigB family)